MFTEGAYYATPAPGRVETAPRWETVGAAALRSRFAERGAVPWTHSIGLAIASGSDVLVEGVVRDRDGVDASVFLLGVRVVDGLIDRFVAFASAEVAGPPRADVRSDEPAADVRAMIGRYFSDLERRDAGSAVRHFTPSVTFSHPLHRRTGSEDQPRVAVRGRSDLRAALDTGRLWGVDHRPGLFVQRGRRALMEGVTSDRRTGEHGSFMATMTIDADGSIDRYVEFSCRPAVRR